MGDLKIYSALNVRMSVYCCCEQKSNWVKLCVQCSINVNMGVGGMGDKIRGKIRLYPELHGYSSN